MGLKTESNEELLATRRPLGAIFEQVVGFEDECAPSQFMSMLRTQGYEVAKASLDAKVCARVSRPRFYLAAFSEALGGRAAAEMWCEKMQQVVKYGSIAVPAEVIGDILSEGDIRAMNITAPQDRARCLRGEGWEQGDEGERAADTDHLGVCCA